MKQPSCWVLRTLRGVGLKSTQFSHIKCTIRNIPNPVEKLSGPGAGFVALASLGKARDAG